MNAVVNLDFENHLVRIVTKDDEPWFVGNDVCRALSLANPRTSLDRLDDDEKGVHTMDTLGGNQEMTIISEPGVYRLIFTSRKEEAERFKRWLAHEVLPSIRRTGRYEAAPVTRREVEIILPHDGKVDLRNADNMETLLRLMREATNIFGREAAADLWIRSRLPKPRRRLRQVSYGAPEDDGLGALKHLFRHAAGNGLAVRQLYRAAKHDDIARGRLLRLGIRTDIQGKPGLAAIANDHPFLTEVFEGTQWAGQWHVALAILEDASPARNPLTFDRKRPATLVPLATLDAIA